MSTSTKDNRQQLLSQQTSPLIYQDRGAKDFDIEHLSPIQPAFRAQSSHATHFENNKPKGSYNNMEDEREERHYTPNTLMKEFYQDQLGMNSKSKENYSLQQQQYDLYAKEMQVKSKLEKGKGSTADNKKLTEGSQISGATPTYINQNFTDRQGGTTKISYEKQDPANIKDQRRAMTAQEIIQKQLRTHDSFDSDHLNQYTITSNDKLSNQNIYQLVDKDNFSSIKQQKTFLSGDKDGYDPISYKASKNQTSNVKEIFADNINKISQSFLEDIDESADIFFQKNFSKNDNQLNHYHQSQPQTVQKNGLKYQKQKLTPALQSLINNSIDCQLCNEQKMYRSSMQCSVIEAPKTRVEVIVQNLEKKYLTSREYYNVKLINDIIYNENTHIVSVFKDYLIFDDVSEFLKRFYNFQETVARLPKMYEFYEKCSKVFPNYVSLPENKYMFKNIERKQRLYDEKQRIIQEQIERQQKYLKAGGEAAYYRLGSSAEKGRHKDRFSGTQNSSNLSIVSGQKLFTTTFVNSVANIEPSGFIESFASSRINNSRYQDHMLNSSKLTTQKLSNPMKKNKRKSPKNIEDMNMDELISKFVAKDSQSMIQQSIDDSTLQNQQTKDNKQSIQNQDKKQNIYEYKERMDGAPQQLNRNILTENKKELFGATQQVNLQKPIIENKNQKPVRQLQNINPQQMSQNQLTPQQQQIIQQELIRQAVREEIDQLNLLQQQQQNCKTPYKSQVNTGCQLSPNLLNNEQQHKIQNSKKPNIKEQLAQGGSGLSVKQNNSGGNNIIPQQQLQHQKSTNSLQKLVEQNQSPATVIPIKKAVNQNDVLVSKYMTSGPQNLKGVISHLEDGMISAGPVSRDLSKEKDKIGSKQITTPQVGRAVTNYNQIQLAQHQIKPKFDSLINNKNVTKQEESSEQQQYIQSQQNIYQQSNYIEQQQNQQESQNIRPKSSEKSKNQRNKEKVSSQINQIHSSNIRSVERLKSLEDEIEKDYSKYLNDNGLSKTAFAKAVNVMRAKQLQSKQQFTQPIGNVVLSARVSRTGINSSEKEKGGVTSVDYNMIRSGSTSQQRISNINKSGKTNNYQEPISIDQHQIRQQATTTRGARAKAQVNSQNSSNCMQRSSKLSPDKKLYINNTSNNPNQLSQFANIQSVMSINQSQRHLLSGGLQQDGQTSIKSQLIKNSKNMKIKFPNNNPSNGSKTYQQNQATTITNSSQSHTPKRIKLQKTKSTSHIPSQNTCKNQNNVMGIPNTFRERQSDIGLVPNNESLINNQQIGMQFMPPNAYQRLAQNFARTQSHAQLGEVGQMHQIDNQITQNVYAAPSHNYVSNCQTGNNATTSIIIYPMCTITHDKAVTQPPMLSSPVSYRNAPQTQRGVTGNSQQSSRNGASQQNYSQKSNAHQRSNSTSTNLLLSNTGKIPTKNNKRNSMGSNILKKLHNQHQQQQQLQITQNTDVSKQQMLQLLMAYQNNNQENGMINGNLAINSGNDLQSFPPSSQTQKMPYGMTSSGLNSVSMKDLKAIKQATKVLIQNQDAPNSATNNKSSKGKVSANTISIKQKLPKHQHTISSSGLISHRQSSTNNIIFGNSACGGVSESNTRRASKSGKNTARADSQKRVSGVMLNLQNTQQQSNQDALQQMKQFYNYMK